MNVPLRDCSKLMYHSRCNGMCFLGGSICHSRALLHAQWVPGRQLAGALEFAIVVMCCCSPAAVVIKMALDQVLLSPIGICLFYSIIKTMEGATFAAVL